MPKVMTIGVTIGPAVRLYEEAASQVASEAGLGLGYNERTIAFGAQTERRADERSAWRSCWCVWGFAGLCPRHPPLILPSWGCAHRNQGQIMPGGAHRLQAKSQHTRPGSQ
jgi:hypothetical protein